MILLWGEKMWFWQAPFFIALWIISGILFLFYIFYELVEIEIVDAWIYFFNRERFDAYKKLGLLNLPELNHPKEVHD